ncbi:MAG: tetratricopeptide repeat protein, partial [Armatimonadetes bacterium]|nr:tetratricopeptide repeat protein [Armatimonadota bacterium]NIM66599.1 tetratricopeptide repeat protein [Armatimonadota bacterium]NIN04823.1 tetratricopeptide repeat protein [Armatimonadota bacterium]NIT30126.1 tetratricopeptide repeat protein [Armatimonadota bacterium]
MRNWSKAIESFERLRADHPGSVASDREVRIWIMDCHLAKGELEKCLSLRKELLNESRRDAWKLYYIVGRRYVWRHKYSKAIPELKQAVELSRHLAKDNRDVLDANKRLLHCYIIEKQWGKAEELAQRLMKDYPDEAYQWHYAFGKCYQGRREYDKAVESLETAADATPKNAFVSKDIFKALLYCYFGTRKFSEAISLGEKLVEDYPREVAWQWEVARFYLSREEYDKAASHFKKVVQSSKKRWEIRSSHIYLGECLYKLGRGNEAMEGVEKYYNDKPKLWDEHLLVKGAVLFYGPEDFGGCAATLQELIAECMGGRKSSLLRTAKELMCRAQEHLGDYINAAYILEDLASRSNDAALLYRAAEDYSRAGKYTEARRAYRAVMERAGVPDRIRASSMYGLALCYWDTGLKNSARRLALRVTEQYP